MNELKQSLLIRPAEPQDKNFIFKSWLEVYKSESRFGRDISSHVFYPFHQRVIERIVSRPQTQILVASPKDDPFLICGFLVFEGNVIHYAYTRKAFRRMGVARALVEHTGIDPLTITFTHQTFDLLSLRDRIPSATYNPYLI